MTEYCRLCAELKDPDEIVASISDIGQSIELKLRSCCLWSKQTNIEEHRLPHSVCAICLDRLDKCWLFSQSVRLAHQRLLEIFQERTENNSPSRAIVNAETLFFQCHICHKSFESHRSLQAHCKYQNRNRCEICSHEFCTSAELTKHQPQGCEGLIEIGSMAMDCKPTAVDWNLDHHAENNDDKHAIDNDANANERNSNRSDQREDENRTDDSKNISATIPMGTTKPPSQNQSKGQVECDECGRTFPYASRLRAHQRYAHSGSENRYKCEDCDESFAMKTQLVSHRRLNHANKRYPCDQCDRSFSNKMNLKAHKRCAHRTDHPFKCDVCGKGFNFKKSLNDHSRKHTGEQLPCKYCGRAFWLKHSLRAHERIVHLGIRKFECNECGKHFVYQAQLISHAKKHSRRNTSLTDTQIERPFECWLCHKIYRERHLLKRHMMTHMREREPIGEFCCITFKRCICEWCGKAYKCEFFLSNHIKITHSTERPFKCETCGLGFKIERLLNAHRISHTEYEFKCTQCDKKFRQKRSLVKHMEYHTGTIVKRFICDICEKPFRENSDLKEHRRIHTGEKPYTCQHCASNFRTMSSFYSHLKKQHGQSNHRFFDDDINKP